MAAILSQVRSTVEDSFPAKPTPEQLKESAPQREAQRQAISDLNDTLSDRKTISYYTDLSGQSLLTQFQSYIKNELAWWNANVELTPEGVKKRTTQEKEQIDSYEKQTALLEKESKENKKNQQEQKQQQIQETLTRGWLDDVNDAIKIAVGSSLIIFWILLGIRLGGLLANDLLYKPIPYRALAFAYSFIFLPILIPYWLYREIKHLFFKSNDSNAPHFESIFPVVPYDPAEPLTLEKRLYGYANTPALNSWIAKKQQEEQQSWLDVLGGNLLQTLIAQREEEKA